MPNITIIAACTKDGVIGIDNKLPWSIRSEMENFLKRVAFKPLIMGRRTCLSLKKPINTAKNYVLTSDESFLREGFITVNSMEEMFRIMGETEHIVVGGAGIYEQFLSVALGDNDIKFMVELSMIEEPYKGDSYFPLDKLEGLYSEVIHRHSENGKLVWSTKVFYKKN